MPLCLIGLGSNQGDRRLLLETATARVVGDSGGRLVARSSWRETSPVGGPPNQPMFLNGALLIDVTIGPESLLAFLQKIEHDLGRRRDERWSRRTIDLDLLVYEGCVRNTPSLRLPHPRMAWRRFVLEPVAEVAPTMTHPTLGWTMAQLLEHLNTTPRYVAITGPIAVGKSQLAQRVASAIGANLVVEQPDWGRLAEFYGDPASHGWTTELEFLDQRARLLEDVLPLGQAGTPVAQENHWTISDFWFDQSVAFARAWLSGERFPAFVERWRERRQTVARPRLVVLLDLPGEALIDRLHRRGRACERPLTVTPLERIRQSLIEEVHRPGAGPVLELTNDDHEAAFADVLAAVQAMG
jgi:2-amino-4-hydroxy-6-hydroxymethyldihydropteridine diphosphokinase